LALFRARREKNQKERRNNDAVCPGWIRKKGVDVQEKRRDHRSHHHGRSLHVDSEKRPQGIIGKNIVVYSRDRLRKTAVAGEKKRRFGKGERLSCQSVFKLDSSTAKQEHEEFRVDQKFERCSNTREKARRGGVRKIPFCKENSCCPGAPSADPTVKERNVTFHSGKTHAYLRLRS